MRIVEIGTIRNKLLNFMNKLMNDEIICDIFDDEFEKKYAPMF